jgi:hypothetical protein
MEMDSKVVNGATSKAATNEVVSFLALLEEKGAIPDAFRGVAKVLTDSAKRSKKAGKKDSEAKDHEHRNVGLAANTLRTLLQNLGQDEATVEDQGAAMVDTLETLFDDTTPSNAPFCLLKAIRVVYDLGEDRNRIKGFLMADNLLGAITQARERIKEVMPEGATADDKKGELTGGVGHLLSWLA